MPEQKIGQRIVLNDGTTIEDGSAGYSSGKLWCWFRGFTLPEASAIFFDSEKTRRIVYEYGEMSDVYVGYTEVISMFIDEDGQVSICLVKGSE